MITFALAVLLPLMSYEKVVIAHGSLPALSERNESNGSTALADAKTDLAKAEATVESLVTAAKNAV